MPSSTNHDQARSQGLRNQGTGRQGCGGPAPAQLALLQEWLPWPQTVFPGPRATSHGTPTPWGCSPAIETTWPRSHFGLARPYPPRAPTCEARAAAAGLRLPLVMHAVVRWLNRPHHRVQRGRFGVGRGWVPKPHACLGGLGACLTAACCPTPTKLPTTPHCQPQAPCQPPTHVPPGAGTHAKPPLR